MKLGIIKHRKMYKKTPYILVCKFVPNKNNIYYQHITIFKYSFNEEEY